MWRQGALTPVCPETPRLDGQTWLVTGGADGVGLGTSRGLLARGARVLSAARSAEKGERAAAALRDALGPSVPFVHTPLDLADLDGIGPAVALIRDALGGRPLDGLVCNAGLWPQRHGLSPQGHELAFATNVLGHFALVRALREEGLRSDARVVVVTGDIYVLARDCTPGFAFRTPYGGMLAYCRSKLGNLWIAAELQRRAPALRVAVVHPGVVATSLGGAREGLADAISRRLLIDVDRGAQTSLYAATQPDVPPGAYLHNTLGWVTPGPGDPASDAARAAGLWERCEALCSGPPAVAPGGP